MKLKDLETKNEHDNIRVRDFEKISFEQFKKDLNEYIPSEDLIKDIYENINLPRRGTFKSSGYDFYAPYNFALKPKEEVKIPTGIKVYMLDDEELLLFPRSSLGFKYNMKFNNTIPKIDSDYYNNPSNEGHIWVKFTNMGNKTIEITKGDAMCQASFYKYLITDTDNPVSKDRIGGIGSTDKQKN